MARTDEARDRLIRDLAEAGGTEDLAEIMAFLDAYPSPEPPPIRTQALIERLRPYVPARSGAAEAGRFRRTGLSASPLALLGGCFRAQLRLFRPAWWAGSALAVLLWLGVARLFGWSPSLVVPLLVAGSVAYAFREARTPALEMELSCPVRPAHIVLARMMLILSWVALLGAPASILAGRGVAAAAGPLAAWAAGMLFCSGCALLGALWFGTPGALTATAVGALSGVVPLQGLLPRAPWALSNGGAALAGVLLLAVGLALSERLRLMPRGEE